MPELPIEGTAQDCTVYADIDQDGWGDSAVCADQGAVVPGDCDDTDPDVHPDADEVCDGLDNDCNTRIDDDPIDALAVRPDADEDGYGASYTLEYACEVPAGYTTDDGDCDDTDPAVHVGAQETCDGDDQDCDGSIDEDASDAVEWFVDNDRDHVGAASLGVSCDPSSEPAATVDGDCVDSDDQVYPGQAAYFHDPTSIGGYDYDCDGVEVMEFTTYGDCDLDWSLTCTYTPGWDYRWWEGDEPQCGGSFDYMIGCTSSCARDSEPRLVACH
jgi:hypothetical protein